MSCPVDPIKWASDNRVALYPGKVNRWVLVRTMRDDPSAATVRVTTRAVMGKWFGDSGAGVITGDAGDTVDHITVGEVSRTRPVPLPTEQRREELSLPPTMAPSTGGYLYVPVAFNYRGLKTSMPWPVWTSDQLSVTRAAKLCPVGCDWMLAQAAAPTSASPLASVAPELSASEKLGLFGRDLSEALSGAGQGAMLAVKYVPLIVMGGLAVKYLAPIVKDAVRSLTR